MINFLGTLLLTLVVTNEDYHHPHQQLMQSNTFEESGFTRRRIPTVLDQINSIYHNLETGRETKTKPGKPPKT